MMILEEIELPDKADHKLLVKFNAINNLNLNNIGGKYNQIMGFEILDQVAAGWNVSKDIL